MLCITDCGVTCHSKCSNQLPNDCGLPAELIDFELSLSAKRPKREEKKDSSGAEEAKRVVEGIVSSSIVERPEDVVKTGRVHVSKYVYATLYSSHTHSFSPSHNSSYTCMHTCTQR